MELISIIIPNLNNPAMLEDCVASLKEHAPKGVEIIVVDNGSRDVSLSVGLSDVVYLRLPSNTGFAHACNLGARIASGDFLIFLNNDTVAESDFVSPMIRAFKPGVGAVGSRLTYPDGSIQHAGIELLLDPHGYLQGSNLKVERSAGTVQAVTGACMAVRKFAFWEAQGFDEGYWNGNEDVDLCLSLSRNNWDVFYEPESTLVHLESQSGIERWTCVNQNVERLTDKWKQYISFPQ